MKRVVRGITKPKPKPPEPAVSAGHVPEPGRVLRRQISIDPEGQVMVPIINEERLQRALNEIPRNLLNRLDGARNDAADGIALAMAGGTFTVNANSDSMADIDFSSIEQRIIASMDTASIPPGRIGALSDAFDRRTATGRVDYENGGPIEGMIPGVTSRRQAERVANWQRREEEFANVRIDPSEIRAGYVRTEDASRIERVGLVPSVAGYGTILLHSLMNTARSWHANVNPEIVPPMGIEWEALCMMVRILWPSAADECSQRLYKDALLYTYQLAGIEPPESVVNASRDIQPPAIDLHAERLLRDIADVLNRNPMHYLGA